MVVVCFVNCFNDDLDLARLFQSWVYVCSRRVVQLLKFVYGKMLLAVLGCLLRDIGGILCGCGEYILGVP